jgi:hypothetical protein
MTAFSIVELYDGLPRERLTTFAPRLTAYVIPAATDAEVPDPDELRTLTGRSLTVQATPATPLPLLPFAPTVPAQ